MATAEPEAVVTLEQLARGPTTCTRSPSWMSTLPAPLTHMSLLTVIASQKYAA
jgi:hypothetical protein